MFSENKKELVLKGVVQKVQGILSLNNIELTDKRLSSSFFASELLFRLKKDFVRDIPFERNDDVEIIIRVKNGKKK